MNRILIVDDEEQIQKLLAYGLGEEGFEIRAAWSGEEALEILLGFGPVCVLLDVGLPQINGIETLKKLRELSKVPVIMLTVDDDDDIKVNAFDLGADDYVTKPFSMPVLHSRIKAVLRRLEKPSSDQIRIDVEAHKVWVRSQEVRLTVTEFELLALFLENRGKVVSHQSILAKIWGKQAGDQMHYLRVYINNLRRKIESNPTIPKLILTEPGIGYRFEG